MTNIETTITEVPGMSFRDKIVTLIISIACIGILHQYYRFSFGENNAFIVTSSKQETVDNIVEIRKDSKDTNRCLLYPTNGVISRVYESLYLSDARKVDWSSSKYAKLLADKEHEIIHENRTKELKPEKIEFTSKIHKYNEVSNTKYIQ